MHLLALPMLFHGQNTFACFKSRALSSALVIQKHCHLDRFSGGSVNSEMGTPKCTGVMKIKILMCLLVKALQAPPQTSRAENNGESKCQLKDI